MASKEKPERSRLNVFVRCRPHLQHDITQESILTFPSKQEVIVNDDVHHQIRYKFDHVFPPDETLPAVFEIVGEPLVTSVLSGVSSCLMAYGQLSTGKTYNMLSDQSGIINQSIQKIFERAEDCPKYNYKVVLSFLQIYQDRIYDLLNQHNLGNTSLALREHPKEGVMIEGLTSEIIENLHHAQRLLQIGKERLVVSQNSKTIQLQSRSHAICIIQVEKFKKLSNFENTLDRMMTKNGKIKGRLFLCDLAGSERLNKSGVSRRHVEEARYINTSLLELGNVIHALTSRSNLYVPFRNSTLTRILKESLGGNSKASLMVCVSPATTDLLETKYSLNFGQRAMKMVKHTMVNVEPRTDSHWLNYPLFRRRRTKKIDYRKLAEYLTNKLKELESAYNKEKDNLRTLKRKLSKKRSDFIRNKTSESESESNESTPSKITTSRKLSILLEESITKEISLGNKAECCKDEQFYETTIANEILIHPKKETRKSQINTSSYQVKEIATQTTNLELVSNHTSNSCLFDESKLKRSCMDKGVGTSSQSLHNENLHRQLMSKAVNTSFQSLTSLKSIAINTSLQDINSTRKTRSQSVNTSLQSIILSASEDILDKSINTSSQSLPIQESRKPLPESSSNTHCKQSVSVESQTEVTESPVGTITNNSDLRIHSPVSSNINIDKTVSKSDLSMAQTSFVPKEIDIESAQNGSDSNDVCENLCKVEIEPDDSEHNSCDNSQGNIKTKVLSLSPMNIHEYVGERKEDEHMKSIQQQEPFDTVDGCSIMSPLLEDLSINNQAVIIEDEPILSHPSTPLRSTDLMLVNYKCSDADSEISLREAKILQSSKDMEEAVARTSTCLDLPGHSQAYPASPLQSYPYASIESETESIYREDTRYAKKSLQKAQNRYSALLHQLEYLASKDAFVPEACEGEIVDDDCHDIILKFKTELEDELNRAKNNLSTPDTLKMPENYSSGIASKSSTGQICCIENERSVKIADICSRTGSSSGSDKTPSGVFEDDFIGRSREMNNNRGEKMIISEEECFYESTPPLEFLVSESSRMEGQISPDVKESKKVSTEDNFQNKTKSQLHDEKFLKQRKLTIAAIENAEIKKELLLTKLEKLRLEAVLSCVLIDTESNDMTKEFQQLSMRSMKGLTSSKSTLASTASCAHLPSISSPVSTFKSLQSPIKKYKYKERFIGADHIVNDVKRAGKVSLIDESTGVTRSVQTEQNVVDWLNSDHVTPKKQFEDTSYQSSSEFDVSSISDLGSPLLLTRRLSPCGQDTSPYSPHDYIFDTDFDEVDKLLLQYKKKKTNTFSLSCFPFMRSKKQKLRDNLQTGTSKMTSTELTTDT